MDHEKTNNNLKEIIDYFSVKFFDTRNDRENSMSRKSILKSISEPKKVGELTLP